MGSGTLEEGSGSDTQPTRDTMNWLEAQLSGFDIVGANLTPEQKWEREAKSVLRGQVDVSLRNPEGGTPGIPTSGNLQTTRS